jgi:hypothetical protein
MNFNLYDRKSKNLEKSEPNFFYSIEQVNLEIKHLDLKIFQEKSELTK